MDTFDECFTTMLKSGGISSKRAEFNCGSLNRKSIDEYHASLERERKEAKMLRRLFLCDRPGEIRRDEAYEIHDFVDDGFPPPPDFVRDEISRRNGIQRWLTAAEMYDKESLGTLGKQANGCHRLEGACDINTDEDTRDQSKCRHQSEDMFTLETYDSVYESKEGKAYRASQVWTPSNTALSEWYNAAIIPRVIEDFRNVSIAVSSKNDNENQKCLEAKDEVLHMSSFHTPKTARRQITEFQRKGDTVKVTRKVSTESPITEECTDDNDIQPHSRNRSATLPNRQSYMSVNAPDSLSYSTLVRRNTMGDASTRSSLRSVDQAYRRRFQLHRASQCSEESQSSTSSYSTSSNDTADEKTYHQDHIKQNAVHLWPNETFENVRPMLRRSNTISSCSLSMYNNRTVEDLITCAHEQRRNSDTRASMSKKKRGSFSLLKRGKSKLGQRSQSEDSSSSTQATIDVRGVLKVQLPIKDGGISGIKLGGGCTTAYGDSCIFVSEMSPDGATPKQIKTGDQILAVNDTIVEDMTLIEVNKLLEKLTNQTADFVILRR